MNKTRLLLPLLLLLRLSLWHAFRQHTRGPRPEEEGGGWGGGGQGEETARLVCYRRKRISDAR
jgi:hypothetical protein